MRAARAWHDLQGARFCRFGDNMRQVAVTEGDKVSAELRFGFATHGHGGRSAARVAAVGIHDRAIDRLCAEYAERYVTPRALRRGGARHESLRYAVRLELGLRAFLEEGGCKGFTTTFEDLHGLRQLPGLAAQRLMAEGYGFAAEGDWKTAALVRAMKVMGAGLEGVPRSWRTTPTTCGATGCRRHAGSVRASRPAGPPSPCTWASADAVFDARLARPSTPPLSTGQPLPSRRQRSGRRKPRSPACGRAPSVLPP